MINLYLFYQICVISSVMLFFNENSNNVIHSNEIKFQCVQYVVVIFMSIYYETN